MGKEIIITDEEKLNYLVEEIKSILTESVFSARMTLLEAKHLVGKTIIDNSLYRKSKKGSGELVKEIAKRLGRSERDIYLCISFYKKYKDIASVIQILKGKKNDITWSAVRRLLEGKKEDCQHKWEEIICWQCKNCSQFRKSKPEQCCHIRNLMGFL